MISAPLNAPDFAEMKKELNEEIKAIDNQENKTIAGLERKSVPVPDALISGIVRAENALICAMVTKNCPDHLKQLAKDSLKPTKDDFEVTRDFFQALCDTYAPELLTGKNAGLWVLGGVWGTNVWMKYQTVAGLVEKGGRK